MGTLGEELEAAHLMEPVAKREAVLMDIAARYNTPEDKKIMQEFISSYLDQLEKDMDHLEAQMKRIEVKQ